MAKKKYKATTDSRHTQLVAPNHLNRNFSVNRLKPVLGGRYHLPLYSGRLALLVDYPGPLFPQNRGNRITPDLVIEALSMAIKQKSPLAVYSYIQTEAANMPAITTRHCWAKEVSYVR